MLTQTAAPIEKIYHVVQMIEHQRALSSKDATISFSINDAIQKPLNSGDLSAILRKLAQDEGAIVLHERQAGMLYWAFHLTPKFDDCSRQIKAEHEEFQKNKPKPQQEPFSLPGYMTTPYVVPSTPEQGQLLNNFAQQEGQKESRVFVRFDELNRHILLNDSFLIAQPGYDSENHRFFTYVWKNPNRPIPLKELNQKLDEPLKKPLAKILDNLNFNGPLKDAFFQVSKTSVCFTPSRSVEELTQAGLYPLRLFSTQKADEG